MCISIPSTLGAAVTPGGLEFGTSHDPLDGDEVKLSIGAPFVHHDLGLERIDPVVGHQLRVEVVVAHRAGRRMGDAAGDDPHTGAVHPAELVAVRDRRLDPVVLRRRAAELARSNAWPAWPEWSCACGSSSAEATEGMSATPAATNAASPSTSASFQLIRCFTISSPF